MFLYNMTPFMRPCVLMTYTTALITPINPTINMIMPDINDILVKWRGIDVLGWLMTIPIMLPMKETARYGKTGSIGAARAVRNIFAAIYENGETPRIGS